MSPGFNTIRSALIGLATLLSFDNNEEALVILLLEARLKD